MDCGMAPSDVMPRCRELGSPSWEGGLGRPAELELERDAEAAAGFTADTQHWPADCNLARLR